MRVINENGVNKDLVAKLSNELSVSSSISKLLINRGIKDYNSAKDFFRPNLKHTHYPFLMKNMDFVKRINHAKKHIVYGINRRNLSVAIAFVFIFTNINSESLLVMEFLKNK